MKKQMGSLFEVKIEDPDEVKSTKFISKLQEMGFIGKNQIFIQNYLNADLSIAFSHIKKSYKQYVLKGNWSEEKFEDIVLLIAKNRKMLIPSVFLQYGAKYDDGKLKREIAIERLKYNSSSTSPSKSTTSKPASDDEAELLKYISENGGSN